MKKLLCLLVACLLALSLVACGSEESEGGSTSTEGETAGKTKVAVLLPFIGDQSYFDTLAKGVAKANETLDVEVTLFEVGNTIEEAAWMQVFDEVCEDGEYELVVSGNNSYEANLYLACEKYPDQMFMNFDYSSLPTDASGNEFIPSNCYLVNYGLDDLGYVVGALSAALTKTGTVGVVIGLDIPAMNQFISGWCQVLAANDVKYAIAYNGGANPFTDTALGKENAEALIKKGADVIWQVAGGAGNGVIEACSGNEDVWCIGVDQDQYVQFEESNPDWANTIITSALKNTDTVLVSSIKMLLDGTLASKMGTAQTWGIAEDAVGLAENDFYLANVPEDVRAQVTATLEAVKNGEVEVEDCLTYGDNYETKWAEVSGANRID